ncbi:MAG: DUF3817 domain-containing protein [Bacteroidota bacterium]|nr:DUF3817 domain-containing protein [Bacteroidota bacterium]
MIKEIFHKPMETALSRFRLVAFLEGCSYLLFGLTMPLKYVYNILTPNYYVGMIHGVLFLLYCLLLVLVAKKNHWSFKLVVIAFIASLVPFGTFYADKRWFNKAA